MAAVRQAVQRAQVQRAHLQLRLPASRGRGRAPALAALVEHYQQDEEEDDAAGDGAGGARRGAVAAQGDAGSARATQLEQGGATQLAEARGTGGEGDVVAGWIPRHSENCDGCRRACKNPYRKPEIGVAWNP